MTPAPSTTTLRPTAMAFPKRSTHAPDVHLLTPTVAYTVAQRSTPPYK